jgi:hypothetical protein
MADQITQDEQGRTYRNGVLQVSSAPDPSAAGAIRALVSALASALGPKSITQQPQRMQQQMQQAEGAAPQGGDLGSQF